MSRFIHPTLALAFALALVTALGCNGSSRRGLGTPRPTPDTGIEVMPDGGVPDGGDPDGGDVDSAIEETPPPACGEGFTDCGGMCVDTESDDFHCGGCDIVCGSGSYCDVGDCVEEGPTCPSPRTMCGESCVDTQTNISHCGGCFDGCAADEACRSGSCVSTCVPSCGGASCGSDGCGGTCGTCSGSAMCVSGRCETPPPTSPGERCSTATPLFASATFTFSGHVADHTPFSCGASASRPDVAYVYTALSSGPVTITAVGASGADTMLAVYDGSPCTSTYEVACNDDSPTSGGYDSEVTFTASAFANYYIVVAPYSSTTPTDTITLTIR